MHEFVSIQGDLFIELFSIMIRFNSLIVDPFVWTIY